MLRRSRFRPQLEQLEGRLTPATLTVRPWSDPADPLVVQITAAAQPGLRTAAAHSGGVVEWSLGDAGGAALSAEGAAQFHGTGQLTAVTFHGNRRSGPVEGSATQLGNFTGNLDAEVTRLGADETATGTLTLVTASGDRLVLSFRLVRQRGSDSFVGTYTVAGGTGRFAGATGEGTMTLTPQPDLTAGFTLDGSLRA